MRRPADGLSTTVAALVPVALSTMMTFHITTNYFWADDFYHLYRMRNDRLIEYLFRPQGGHVQATQFGIAYAINQLAGTRPEPYFWSAVITHVVNVALLFVVI